PEMIGLITDTMLNSSFPAEELEKQRRISIARIVSQNDSWFQEGFINFAKVFFKGHPFAMPTLGSTNIVSKLTVKDLQYFHSKIIQPSNIVISVSGNFDVGNVSELLNKGIGCYAASTTPFSKPVVAKPEVKDKYVSVAAPRKQATVVMGFNAPSALNTNRFPFFVGESYISGSGGPLFRALRGNAALVYVVFAFPFIETEAGALIMMAQCDPKNVDLVREKMLEVANSMVMNPLTTNSVSMSINATLIPYQLNRQTVQSIAGQAAVWEYRGLGANAGKIFIDKISNVTSDQIQQNAAEYFKNWTCVVTKPESQDD
ncbi:MAG: insulinase family protein, partial [Candidatus Heimdallarchaeota archaeon]|nr:insulinase family protein [Candidatus Heimdallarchaeota archaeon]